MKNWSDYVVAIFLLLSLLSLLSERIQHQIRTALETNRKLIFLAPSTLVSVNCWHNWINGNEIKSGWLFACYLFLPTVLLFVTAKSSNIPRTVGDLSAVITFWLPIDSRYLDGSWANNLWYQFSCTSGIVLAVVIFVCYRKLEKVNYNLLLRKQDFDTIGRLLACLIIILLPVGLTSGFLSWNQNSKILPMFPFVFIGIFLTTALAEELLFRGLIQNLLNNILRRQTTVLVLSAIIFGLGHLNNPVGHFYPPNYLYMLMATIAGLAYGTAYIRSNSILVPSLLHALVDTIWGLFFLAPKT